MIETELRPARRALAAADGANAADRSKSRLAMRLWMLLHAQALLEGTIGDAGGALAAEDDRWRLAARRERHIGHDRRTRRGRTRAGG